MITGATEGIGRAFVLALAAEGRTVTAVTALRRRRRPTVVPGRANALPVAATRFLPRTAALSLLADGTGVTAPRRARR